MIIVLGSAVVQEGRIAEALTLSEAHVARSRTEPGCLAHAVHRDTGNPSRLVFVEQWETRDTPWAHCAVPASRAFGKALAGLSVGIPAIDLYEATSVALPQRGAA